MASTQSKVLLMILKLSGMKKMINNMFDHHDFHQNETNKPPKNLYKTLLIETSTVDGRNVFKLSPKTETTNKHILYLHGGAYVKGLSKIHWDFFNTLTLMTNCTLIVPDYHLAPDYTYKDSFRMIELIYEKLILESTRENIIFMGDSSGGGFALALAQKLKKEKNHTVNQIILLSPWLDVTMTNPTMLEIEEDDPILEITGLKRAGIAYAGDTSTSHYLLSPIYGDIEGLGKISIFIGTKDILEADTRKFKKMANEKGLTINYFEYKDMVHVWMMMYLPESKQAIEQISNLIKASS